jgi:predicted acetyltransferase
LEVHLLSAEDQPAYQHIASHSFARGEPIEFGPDEFLPPDRVRLGVFEYGRLQAQYTILEFELFFGADKRSCGGIASVACEPSARGRGYAGALIDRSLEVMRERGQFLSILWPFDQRFYRRYGWEWTGHDRSYTVPLRLLEADQEADYIEPLFSEYFEALNPIYEAKCKDYHGALVRSQKRWEYLMKPHGKRHPAAYVYRRDGAAEGFAVIRYDEKRDRARANEFVALTPRAYRALLALFKRHSATVEKFVWNAPMDDILWSLINHWDVKTRLVPSAMCRVVDVQAALRALTPDSARGGAASVQVLDSHAPWNDGTWRVESDGGRVSAQRTERYPDIRMDIQAFSEAASPRSEQRDTQTSGWTSRPSHRPIGEHPAWAI